PVLFSPMRWSEKIKVLGLLGLSSGEFLLVALASWISLLAAFVVILLVLAVHRIYRSVMSAMLLYRRRWSWVYFGIFGTCLILGNTTVFYIRPFLIPQ